MSDGSALIYLYDGTFSGFLCCAWRALCRDEHPEDLLLASEAPVTLFEMQEIGTDWETARRMKAAIREKMGEGALALVQRSFLCSLPRRELHIIAFLFLGKREGKRAVGLRTHPDVEPLVRAVRHLHNEAEAFRGFVRFSELGGALVSVIEPKNQVLPLIGAHFSRRYPDEVLVIYDKTHRSVLLSDRGQLKLGYLAEFEPAEAGREERNYRALWQSFYEAISIRQRMDPRCRMSHMPQRYWAQLTEFWEREQYLPEDKPLPRSAEEVRRLSG